MATQTGILGIQGTVGGLVFAKDGSIRQKPASNKSSFLSKDSMARTRENASEFGTAGTAGKLLREALRGAIKSAKDKLLTSRLTKTMRAIINADADSPRGERQVTLAGAIALLSGFNFNDGAKLASVFYAPFSVNVNGSQTVISIPAFDPSLDVTVPQGTTHVELVGAGAALNFATGATVGSNAASDAGLVPLNGGSVANASITLTPAAQISAGSVRVVALGVNFYQEVNGVFYALNNNTRNPLALVSVS